MGTYANAGFGKLLLWAIAILVIVLNLMLLKNVWFGG